MTTARNARLVIGIDPGLASTGYGLVECRGTSIHYVASGIIATSPKTPHPERLLEIHQGLTEILARYAPTEAGMETLYFARNASSAMLVAEARGVAIVTLAAAGVPLAEFTPNAIKKAVVGVTVADKRQVQESVRILLGLSEIPKPDHAADALACAIARIHTADFSAFSCVSSPKRG